MGEASASFGDQNFSEETSNSMSSSGPAKRNNRRSKHVRQGQEASRKRNSSQKEKTCVCEMCDFSTAYSFSLMRHKEKVHKQLGNGDTKVQSGVNVTSEVETKPDIKLPPPTPQPSDPVVLPSMFPSNRPDYLDLQNYSNPSTAHENAQWSIPNPAPASTSIKFETTDGIPINLFESNYTPINQGEFITFRKADETCNNVVETLMNGYTNREFPGQIPGPALPSLANYNASVQVVQPEKQKSPMPHSTQSASAKLRTKKSNDVSSTKNSKKGNGKKLINEPKVGEVGEKSSTIYNNKSVKKSTSQKTRNNQVETGNTVAKKRRSQSKHVKIMITSTVSQCPLCKFASKYPSNTGRHFYGIHKEEYSKVVRGELQIEGIKYREERTKKPKEKATSPIKNMVELKIPQVTAPLRHDFDNPPILVPQSTIAPTAAQELEQFVQQENLEMFASGEPDNLDLNTEPMASFIESLLSSSSEPSDWYLSHVESQYPQPSSTFTPTISTNFGHAAASSNVVPPVASQSLPVNYVQQYHEIPQTPVIAHSQLQPIPAIGVPAPNFTVVPTLKVEQNLVPPHPDGRKRNQKRKASTERPAGAARPKIALNTEEEKETKRKRALERKRELRKQKKLQKDAEKLATSRNAPVSGTLEQSAPVVNQSDWSSQYFQIPSHAQTFTSPQIQNHPPHFEPLKSEGIVSNQVQANYLPMPLQSPGMKPQSEHFSVLDHSMGINQPAISPAPPVLSMPAQVSMNTPHAMGEAVFYENHAQTLPTLAPEYPSPPQLTHMPDYRSQMSLSHVNDFLSPPKLTHSTALPSPPGVSHSSQYNNLSSPVCVAPTIDYQSPSTSQGLSDSLESASMKSMSSNDQPGRRKKSELTQEEIDAARQRHLARRREKYRSHQEAKKNQSYVPATKTQSSGLTPDEEAKRQKKLAKRREVDAARRRQKSQQLKQEMSSSANVASNAARLSNRCDYPSPDMNKNSSSKLSGKMKKSKTGTKTTLPKVALPDPSERPQGARNFPDLGIKSKKKSKSGTKHSESHRGNLNSSKASELQSPSGISVPPVVKSELASTAKSLGLTQEEIEEKKKEKKREQNRRYIMKRRLMAKEAAQLKGKCSTAIPSTSVSSGSSLDSQKLRSGVDTESQIVAKNDPDPVHSVNGSNVAGSYSSIITQADVYKPSSLPTEPMKILDFQQQFLCPLPIQETQAIEAFSFSNTQPTPGPSSFATHSWGSSVKREEYLLENPDTRLESFHDHFNQPSNYNAVIQRPPSKQAKCKKIMLSTEEKETKKKIMLEKRKEQRRINKLKSNSGNSDVSVGVAGRSSSPGFPGSVISKIHELGEPDKKSLSPKKKNQQKLARQNELAEKNAQKLQARERQRDKQREKRRQTAELKRKEKEKARNCGEGVLVPTPQLAFVEVNKPAEMQHCSYQDCDFKTDSKYKLIVHSTFHDALTNMPPLVRSMLEATGNIDFLMKLQPERDPFNGCVVAKSEELAISRSDAVSTGAPG